MWLTRTTVLVSSSASTVLTAPFVRSWLRRTDNFDVPNERSSHQIPTPRGGGLACLIGASVGSAVAAWHRVGPSPGWLSAGGILAAIGRIDDISGLSAFPRLGAQVAVGTIVGASSGGVAGALFGSFAMPAIVNAFNFMDGINGISGGTAAAWGICVATDPLLSMRLQNQGALTAGMGFGFLPSNVPIASMFLGDVGSYLLGAGIAVSIIESAFAGGKYNPRLAIRVAAPMGPYLADTGSTIVVRALRGKTLTAAHRDHAYQRLLDITGWKHWQVALVASSSAALAGGFARKGGGLLGPLLVSVAYVISPGISHNLRTRLHL